MFIRNRTTNKTATRSPFNSQGYKRSEHLRIQKVDSVSTLKESPICSAGAHFQCAITHATLSEGRTQPSAIERIRFHRLGGTIADNHKKMLAHHADVAVPWKCSAVRNNCFERGILYSKHLSFHSDTGRDCRHPSSPPQPPGCQYDMHG